MALAMTGGSLVAATLATTPTSATSISLSIAGATNTCPNTTVANKDTDICFQIPDGGGVGIGKHVLTVTTDASQGFDATFSGKESNYNMVNNTTGDTIKSVDQGDKDDWVVLGDKQYGIATPTKAYPESNYDTTDQSILKQAKFAAVDDYGTNRVTYDSEATSDTGKSVNIYYGARVDDPKQLNAGSYTAIITYTATAKLPPAPTVTNLILNDTALTGQQKEFAIEGTNLSTTSSIWVDYNRNGTKDRDEIATDIKTYPNTDKAETVVSFKNPISQNGAEGSYNLYVETDGGIAMLEKSFWLRKETVCRSGDNNSDCQVDIDDNMIPVNYHGDTNLNWVSNAKWEVVLDKDKPNTVGPWYDYNNKQWANAVTLRDDCSKGVYSVQYVEGNSFFTAARGSNGASQCNTNATNYPPLQATKRIMELLNRGITQGLTNGGNNFWNIPSDDILGYWVYIPRYAYEVQRRDATDKFVMDEYELPDGGKIKNDFIIKFEKSSDTKKVPVACTSNQEIKTAAQMWKDGNPSNNVESNVLAKDYRIGCGLNRKYETNSTWATHPAFTFGDKELNGIWVGKFETTGTRTNPTIKPNQHANISERVGNQFTMAKSIGVEDKNAVGGNTITGITQNSHNLQSATTHMLKNSEWGAVAYLSSSSLYGAGVNNVKNNGYYASSSSDRNTDADGQSTYGVGVTGCGPATDSSGNPTDSTYSGGTKLNNTTTIESPTACSTTDTSKAYNGSVGQLASTTNNIYGIYDMAGGAWEYVMGNWTNTEGQSSTGTNTSYTNYFKTATKPPYVDLYDATLDSNPFGTKPAWSSDSPEEYYNNDVCTWTTCGGHALHETNVVQSVSSGSQSWGSDYSGFVSSSLPWFLRGGSANRDSGAGLFSHIGYDGDSHDGDGFRVALLATQ